MPQMFFLATIKMPDNYRFVSYSDNMFYLGFVLKPRYLLNTNRRKREFWEK